MDESVSTQATRLVMTHQDAWQMVLSQLHSEVSRALFETWVEPLRPLGYNNRTFLVGAANPYGRDWVESRLKARMTHLLEGLYQEPVLVQVVVNNGFYTDEMLPAAPLEISLAPEPTPTTPSDALRSDSSGDPGDRAGGAQPSSPRKVMLQRAYGSRRAAIVQPERGMFLTLYFFNNWLPLLGHSAATVILAARSMCYWNPMTGELRNTVETEMAELAKRAAVSVRTVKDVLAGDLVSHYFLRYKVRRLMTPNGVRTAGIIMQVRMDDPLTPFDQMNNNLPEEDNWYSPEFGPGERDEE
jgi:hypothetical protein